MQLIYLEAGSGALNKVSKEVVKRVANEINIGLIVGGGIRTPEDAKSIVDSGSSFVVVGSALEKSTTLMAEFSSAIHSN
jgi:putative glycerol-1-phosphate prenyltransferase